MFFRRRKQILNLTHTVVHLEQDLRKAERRNSDLDRKYSELYCVLSSDLKVLTDHLGVEIVMMPSEKKVRKITRSK